MVCLLSPGSPGLELPVFLGRSYVPFCCVSHQVIPWDELDIKERARGDLSLFLPPPPPSCLKSIATTITREAKRANISPYFRPDPPPTLPPAATTKIHGSTHHLSSRKQTGSVDLITSDVSRKSTSQQHVFILRQLLRKAQPEYCVSGKATGHRWRLTKVILRRAPSTATMSSTASVTGASSASPSRAAPR